VPYILAVLTFIETRLFTRLADEYLGEEGLLALQVHLLAQPDLGKLIPGSGGVRKLRWGLPGRGKRGGLRVIYYLRQAQEEIWLLTLYAKSVSDNISVTTLRKIKATIDG
jgi:hypothetical protein